MIKKILKNSERGQAIILIAFAIIGMIAIVGLMTDSGILLIEYARLKRGIDAASVAAALQFRRNFVATDLENAAEEFLRLNQSQVTDVQIDTCITLPGDPELCTTPARKLVRVTAKRLVNFGFMRIIGFNSTTITASSIGEAASIDLVLVMDTSSSMSFETLDTGNPEAPDAGEDPRDCNIAHTCQPLEDIKADAIAFLDTMYFPYDRVSIVTLTSQNPAGFRDSATALTLEDGDTLGAVTTALDDIRVYEPPACDSEYGICRNLCDQLEIDYAEGDRNGDGDNTDVGIDEPPNPDDPCYQKPVDYFLGLECPVIRDPNILNPTSCGSSNVGGALDRARTEFAREPNREESLWVVVALIGGPPNSTNGTNALNPRDAYNYPVDAYAFGYCPDFTWDSATDPLCRGGDVSAATRNTTASPLYDADDYARDKADLLAGPAPDGAGVTIFTIGLGHLIQNSSKGDPLAGEKLLQYIALTAGDDPPFSVANHGEYHFVEDPGGPELNAIFTAIAKNIFTRISK